MHRGLILHSCYNSLSLLMICPNSDQTSKNMTQINAILHIKSVLWGEYIDRVHVDEVIFT